VLEQLSNFIDGKVDAGLRTEIEPCLKMRRAGVSHCTTTCSKVLMIVANERAFEIPVGYRERLHALIDQHP
jgi:hypothetical protein